MAVSGHREAVMITRVLLAVLAVIVVDLIVRVAFRRNSPAGPGNDPGRFRWLRVAVNVLGLASLAIVASTAWVANEGSLTGDRLIWHVGSGPAFALGAVAVTLCWAHRNRFSASDANRLGSAGGWAAPLRRQATWPGRHFLGVVSSERVQALDLQGLGIARQLQAYLAPGRRDLTVTLRSLHGEVYVAAIR